jgi:hypothetical protein
MISGPRLNEVHMNESISEIQRLHQEITGHLKSGTKTDARKAVAKLERIAALVRPGPSRCRHAGSTPGSADEGAVCWLVLQSRSITEKVDRNEYIPSLST